MVQVHLRSTAISTQAEAPASRSTQDLRDWFAGQESLPDCDLAISAMEQIIGRKSPKFAESPLDYMIWEADVRAALRYIRADAMIRARNKES